MLSGLHHAPSWNRSESNRRLTQSRARPNHMLFRSFTLDRVQRPKKRSQASPTW